jgi:hypothetical protein
VCALRREVLGLAIGTVDLIGDWFGLASAACDTVAERLCARYDLIPAGVRERATLLKES